MDDNEWLADQFEAHRAHLRGVAYRMLGSFAEADDAVQEAWIRLSRSNADEIENLGGWLTTVVARVSLNVLRSRKTRREEPLDVYVPDPVVAPDGPLGGVASASGSGAFGGAGAGDAASPEQQALLADSVGLALLVVLDMLTPAERLAFVLHDMFAMPFEEIAPIVDRTPDATRQLASRARRRVQGATAKPDPDLTKQREVVDAFFAAARGGDFEALVSVLDPDVVLRADGGARRPETSALVRGADAVASRALMFARPSASLQSALVNGAAGVVVVEGGEAFSLMAFTVADGKIAEIDVINDPDRLAAIDLTPSGVDDDVR